MLEKILAALDGKEKYPEDLARELKIKGEKLEEFWQLMRTLEKQQRIKPTKKGLVTLNKKNKEALLIGKIESNAKGFGFVILDDKSKITSDVFIPANAMNTAMNGDKVLIRLISNIVGKKPEGEIVSILERANDKIVGTFIISGAYAFVLPDSKRILGDVFVAKKHFNQAVHGQKVVVQVIKWPEAGKNAEGRVIEVLGNSDDSDIEILSIIRQQGLPINFPENILQAAKHVPKEVSESEHHGRRDLRQLPIVTIDGEDARDLDDAVLVEKQANGNYKLGVYIADVSYYVPAGSPIDLEARERATSVYLVDRVLPMLPVQLSNGICSLNAGVDRLAMACEMQIDPQGQVVNYEVFPALINVKQRLTYTAVRKLLENEEIDQAAYQEIYPELLKMRELCQVLRDKRMLRGAVDFNFPEQKVKLDKDGKPIDIVQRVRSIAESIVEEFMLVANETVAEHLSKLDFPSIYRVHELPDEEKIFALKKLLYNFNIKLEYQENVTPKAMQQALKAAEEKPEARLLSTVMLRSLKQAKYQVENLGHFGLAAEFYTHFTSPIRRYPDLMVHRLLRESFKYRRQLPEKQMLHYSQVLPEIAERASLQERVAAEAERMTVDYKKAEYMYDRIGEEFEGTISSVTPFGFFVELDNGVEGLVHMGALLDDYYIYVEERYALIGERLKNSYRLGDKVRIEVLQVNVKERNIDFVLAGTSLEDKLILKANSPTGNREKMLLAAGKAAAKKKGKKKTAAIEARKESRSSRNDESTSRSEKRQAYPTKTKAKDKPPATEKRKKSEKASAWETPKVSPKNKGSMDKFIKKPEAREAVDGFDNPYFSEETGAKRTSRSRFSSEKRQDSSETTSKPKRNVKSTETTVKKSTVKGASKTSNRKPAGGKPVKSKKNKR